MTADGVKLLPAVQSPWGLNLKNSCMLIHYLLQVIIGYIVQEVMACDDIDVSERSSLYIIFFVIYIVIIHYSHTFVYLYICERFNALTPRVSLIAARSLFPVPFLQVNWLKDLRMA